MAERMLRGVRVVAPIRSLWELSARAVSDARYAQLAVDAAKNLGDEHGISGAGRSADEALRTLAFLAVATEGEDGGGEAGIVAEVNALRS